jgi:NifU-like protein
MWDYTEKVMDLFHAPHNLGAIATEECGRGETIAVGEVGSIACGDALRLHLRIDTETEKILDARFQTFGCASAIASSSALTDLVQGMTVDEALTITNREIADFLGGLPQEKMHCSVMGQEALEAAIANYRGKPVRNEADDDTPLVCTCFAVSEGRIKRVIRENALTTAEAVTNYIKAGGGCGSCLADIDELLAEVARERQQEELALETCLNLAPKPTPTAPVNSHNSQPRLTTLQKISLIQQVLEEEIRPYLMADGGDLELYDIDGDRVQVILKGACGDCPSSLATLKLGIEETLRERVASNLVVEAVS